MKRNFSETTAQQAPRPRTASQASTGWWPQTALMKSQFTAGGTAQTRKAALTRVSSVLNGDENRFARTHCIGVGPAFLRLLRSLRRAGR